MRVCIIDDDRDHAESLAELVAMRGFEVETAFSGEAGLARFRQVDFDIVFMDVKLPGMNGVETFFAFKKVRPDVKVMLMSGYSVEHLIAQAVENGALGILTKPFEIGQLLDAIEQAKPRGMVLVADDDPELAANLSPVLARHGYSVAIARTGEDALARTAVRDIDCLLLDLRMPVLSGLEIYMQLRQSGWNLPTIFIAAFAGERSRAAPRRDHPLAQELLMKPFDPAELLAAIEAAIPRPHSRTLA